MHVCVCSCMCVFLGFASPCQCPGMVVVVGLPSVCSSVQQDILRAPRARVPGPT